jgi:hypothetical protein
VRVSNPPAEIPSPAPVTMTRPVLYRSSPRRRNRRGLFASHLCGGIQAAPLASQFPLPDQILVSAGYDLSRLLRIRVDPLQSFIDEFAGRDTRLLVYQSTDHADDRCGLLLLLGFPWVCYARSAVDRAATTRRARRRDRRDQAHNHLAHFGLGEVLLPETTKTNNGGLSLSQKPFMLPDTLIYALKNNVH